MISTSNNKRRTTGIGLGLAAIGRPEYINIREQADVDKAEKSYRLRAMDLLEYAYRKGIRDFDTAASYGKGEQFLKDWYHHRHYPDVRLSSKWGYTYKANWEIGYNGAHEVKEHSLSKLQEQWSGAQELLPGLKIYQIHSATFESAVLDNKEVLDELHRIKKVERLRIGLSVSGANQKDVISAATKVEIGGESLFDSFQVTYNILDTSAHEMLRFLLEKGKKIIIKEAMANGRLLQNRHFPQYETLYKRMDEIASDHRVGTDAIAMRYVIDRLQPDLVLSGASTRQQLDSNLKALSIRLSNEEIASLKRLCIDPETYWSERKQLAWN
jgi:aryl-alcohol dehydrogenase-like predicted oxidoreductase